MRMQIDSKDLDDLHKFLKAELKKNDGKVEELLKNTTAHIANEAKIAAPHISGWLRKNIRASKVQDTYEVQSNAYYSYWVEYGNRQHSGVPFFRPAIENGYNYMEQEIKKF